jgi:uncharacterized repeat protein (TIGR02543 family)
VQIDGIKDGFYNEKIIFPDIIDGKEVTQIAEDALQNETEVISVEFGENITNVENSAFEGATALTEVKFNDKLLKIGSRAFQTTGITSIEIPISVKEIWSYAFANSSLKSAKIYNNSDALSSLWFVGEGIFDGTPFINTGTNNIILGKVLVKYRSPNKTFVLTNNSGIKHFAQKCFEGSILEKLDTSAFAFSDSTIPDYFLYGAENLKEVLIPKNIVIIGLSSFEKATSLTDFTITKTVEVIGSRAFAYSGIVNLTIETSYPPVISNSDTFEGVASGLTVGVKSYAVSDFQQSWGNEFVFYTPKGTLNFYDDGNSIFSRVVDYYDYMESYAWMLEGGYAKDGYYFTGWYDEKNNRYYAGSLLEFELDSEWKLTATWQIETYNIWYEESGGNSDNTDYITINETIFLQDSEKTGYIFDGWYDNPSFNGTPIVSLKNINSDIKLYAKFTSIETKLNFDTTGETHLPL